MTQDQYGQARDSGYVAGGQAVDDETDEYSDGQEQKMTAFQKVASAFRGDRSDRDAPDQDVPENAGTTGQTLGGPDDLTAPNGTAADPSGAAAGPNGMAADQASQDTLTPGTGAPDTVAPGTGTQETGAGATRGDYWDANAQDVTATQPDVYDAGAAPVAAPDTASPVAATDTDTTAPADAAGTAYPAAAYPAAAAGTAYPADTGAGTTAATPQGAATISDAPVTQASEDPAEAGPGRHAAASAQELHPGEAAGLHPGETAGSLGDLGDLAYGKLIPDAADFTAQWREIQFKFVDDPQASVTEAAAIVEQVTTKMEAAIQERQRAIAERQRAIQEQQQSLRGRWGEDAEADTETLRATLRMYKAFLDQLVGPKA